MNSYLYGAGAEYALHSLLILATADAPLSVVDLARFQQIPERYLAKVFTRMKDAQLVVGTEGIAGGFPLARARRGHPRGGGPGRRGPGPQAVRVRRDPAELHLFEIETPDGATAECSIDSS